ncbi:polyketide synthase [Kibdelosporangium aridum]|uniref:Polyketide synthase n=1 Tax=Kibdelosporangium aridum TaxID=2030 RepID=A0A428Y2Z2_KIBAR|nr:polyketide synthase [Kibdelosporangium aridum]RSM61931.1 polyketide synthase [Kibdelosporangium aridum]
MRTDYGQRNEIAIVGMAGRFPGADDVDGLWRLLLDGRDGVRELSPDDLREAGVPAELSATPGYIRFATEVSGAADFDAEFFGLTPAEAECTDPQHRLMMECAWRALEDGGTPATGRIGVFVSTESHTYLEQHLLPREQHTGPDLPYRLRLTNQPEFLATRLCYALGITGPAMSISTACSSSLVCVDTACTALIMRRCDVAIAGAAALRLPQASGYLYREGGTWSRDGRCRPFDASASGWIAGNGGGAVVLKRLADAVADRDRIYAVITGSGVNNDGADKISFAAPSTSAQIAVITAAIADAGVPSSDVGYVEAHGSGTVLGDPIEVTALAKAYAAAGGVAQAADSAASRRTSATWRVPPGWPG